MANINVPLMSVVLLVATLAASAQQPTVNPATQQVPPSMSWLDHSRIATCSIGVVRTDERTHRDFFAVAGSGVFVAVDQHTGYLITAKHVFDDPEKNWHPNELRLRFAWQEQKSVFDELGVPLTLKDAKGKALWKSLDDGSDIAAIVPPADIKTNSAEAVFPVSFAKDDDDFFQGASVIVLGYPGVVGNEYLVRAIIRQGIVAWTNPTEPLNNIFMVDANLYAGNSGGPVFRVPTSLNREGGINFGSKAAFLGIVSKVPIQDDPVTVDGQPLSFTPQGQLPTPNHPMSVKIVGVGGIGIIEPASKVLALVQSLQTKK